MNLDKKMEELKVITENLEKGEMTFEESIKSFEKGAALAKECVAALNETKGRVTQIKQDLDAFMEVEFK